MKVLQIFALDVAGFFKHVDFQTCQDLYVYTLDFITFIAFPVWFYSNYVSGFT